MTQVLLSTVRAGCLVVFAAASAAAAPKGTLTVRLVGTGWNPVHRTINVVVQARAEGTGTPGLGDGGIADMGFSIISGNSDVLPASSNPPLSSKAALTWSPLIVGSFSTVRPNRTDISSDRTFDLFAASFFDAGRFAVTDLGTDGFVSIATTTFELRNNNRADYLTIFTDNVNYYDFSDGSAPSLRNTFAATLVSGLTIPPLSFPSPDANGDGIVDLGDINYITDRWLSAGPAGDINFDGIVNLGDINYVTGRWLNTSEPGATSAALAAIPEPACLSLLALATAVAATFRRHRA